MKRISRALRTPRAVARLALVAGLLFAVLWLGTDALRAAPYAGEVAASLGPLQVVDVRVNQSTVNDQHEPTLAVDPTNANNVLVAAKDWRMGPKQVWYYRSGDAGHTWTDGHVDMPTELPNQSDPVLSWDANGTAYLLFIGYNQNDFSIGGLFLASSSDKGATWVGPVQVSANSATLFDDKEWMAIDRSSGSPTKGNIYVTWTLINSQTRDGRADIVLARSTDGGKTFSPRTLVSLQSQGDTQGSYPVVGPRGEVYVLYFAAGSQAARTTDALYVARSTDAGRTFPLVKRVADVVSPPNPMPGSKFRTFVLPALAVDPRSGNLFATWNDSRRGDTDAMLARSTDGGATWSAPIRMNDDPVGNGKDQFFPTLAAGADSTLHALWLDRRQDPRDVRYAPYYTRSTDGGATFMKNAPLSPVLSDPNVGFEGTLLGDYIALDTSADGSRVYAAWVDTRGGDQDIYFTTFGSPSELPPASTPTTTTAPTPVAVPSPQPLSGFSDQAFLLKWERADRPVVTGKAQRPWVWGPGSFAAASEQYAQGEGGQREVQYFDKARMEINNPAASKSSPAYVTNGLLVVELISGRIQVGDRQFLPPRPPSQAPVAGETGSPDALTYGSLAPVASLNGDKRAADRTGQGVTQVLDRSGQVRDDPARAGNIKLAKYEPTTGHNIPDVFWAFLNSSGPIFSKAQGGYSDGPILNWVLDLGLPITEPYWTSVKIAGLQKWVLVQAFQRRVLTYVADNPPGWQVEMGNVGRAYFDWRYGPSFGRGR